MRNRRLPVRISAMILIALVVSLLQSQQAHSGLLSRELGAHHDGPASSEPDGIQAGELGYRFLSTRETLRGQLGIAYETLRQLESGEQSLSLSFTYFMRYPDGTQRQIRLESFAELERLITEIKQQHETYASLIRARTSRPLLSGYVAAVSSGCPQGGFAPGQVQVKPDGLAVELRQASGAFQAIAVDATVTVVFPDPPILPLTGVFQGRDIVLADTAGACSVRLAPSENLN